MPMRFPGKCQECGKKIDAGQVGFWSKGVGVKHEACHEPEDIPPPKAQHTSIRCMVCGAPAGCDFCEMLDDCDLKTVSKNCICKKCLSGPDAFEAYQQAAGSKFPILKQDF